MKIIQKVGNETDGPASGARKRLVGILLLGGIFGVLTLVLYSAKSPVPWLVNAVSAAGQGGLPGTEEFGLTKKQLVRHIEAVEALISKCMAEAGFEYIAASYRTVRRGMTADKSLPGLRERGFIAKHGFGISTLYTGKPPQVADGYSPAKIGLGKQNVRIYKNLSPADQVAYNYALFGENMEASFAVGLEIEDLSRSGGCTRKAVEQVFSPEQLRSTYYNPKDALVNEDPRMVAALKKISAAFHEAGFDYNHPDEVEPDIRRRLYKITGGGTVPIEKLSPEARAALTELQAYERAVAALTFELESQVFDPVEDKVERGLYARKPK